MSKRADFADRPDGERLTRARRSRYVPVPARDVSRLRRETTLSCIICRYRIPPDDVAEIRCPGGCICLECAAHHAGCHQPVPPALRRQITAILAALPAL